MSYNKEELFKLPVEEKIELVEALCGNIDNELSSDSKEDMAFAKERLQLHEENPSDVISWAELKKTIEKKYGF
ncbi:MAG: addiction module protein [Ginsengibacter sp.]